MFYKPEEIISGEKIQELADLYIGTAEDFLWNPRIMEQPDKHQIIDDIHPGFDNPKIVFVYGHLIDTFSHKIHHFKNAFVLITHNADTNLLNDNTNVIEKEVRRNRNTLRTLMSSRFVLYYFNLNVN